MTERRISTPRNWRPSAGTLQGNTTSLQGNIVNNAAVVFDQAATGTYAGAMSGTGSLTKQNAGTLILTGTNSYAGATDINAGTLMVNGSVASNTTVNAGGTLAGTGTVFGTVTNAAAGIISPDIGTLTVSGNVTFAPGSIYQVAVDPNGNSGRLSVVGAPATLNGGTVNVMAGAGTYFLSTRYTILNATGGVTGTFAGVTSNLAFLTPSLSYDPNDVFLTLQRNSASFGSTALTHNQLAVANTLTNIVNSGGGSSGMQSALNNIIGLSAPQARAAFDAIGGASLRVFADAQLSFMNGFGQLLAGRLGSGLSDGLALPGLTGSGLQLATAPLFTDAAPVYAQAGGTQGAANWNANEAPHGLWFRAYDTNNNTSGDGNANGFHVSGSGVSLGVDGQINHAYRLGVAITNGNQHLSTDNSNDTGSSDGTALAFYGQYAEGPWTVTSSFGVATFPLSGSTPQELIQVADASMYLSKHQGGNAVSTADKYNPDDAKKWKRDVLDAYLGVTLKRLFATGPDAFVEIYSRIEQFARSLAETECADPQADGNAAQNSRKESPFEPLPPIVMDTLTSLALAVDAKDQFTQGHSHKVSTYAVLIAEAIGLQGTQIEEIRLGSMLHDVGKVGILESILNKNGPLNPDEWEAMKRHVEYGAKLLEPLRGTESVREMVAHHHEFFDGSGYPDSLSGEQIPLGARIIAIADAYDTITSERTYKKARTPEEALQELERCGNAQFDPELVRLFVSRLRQLPNPIILNTAPDREHEPVH